MITNMQSNVNLMPKPSRGLRTLEFFQRRAVAAICQLLLHSNAIRNSWLSAYGRSSTMYGKLPASCIWLSLVSRSLPQKASVVMQRLSYPTLTVLSNEITRNRIVLSFKDSPRKPLRRRPRNATSAKQCPIWRVIFVVSQVSSLLVLSRLLVFHVPTISFYGHPIGSWHPLFSKRWYLCGTI